MDFEFYRNFITVAETGNITTAAKKLSLAQPALSSQMKTLENFYGVKLIETMRGKRSLSLTEAGMDFLTKARFMCEQEENISINMQTYKKEAKGALRFAVSYSAVDNFISEYLQPFSKLYPKINFQLHEILAQEQVDAVRNGIVDFALANMVLPKIENFITYPLKSEKFYAVYKKKNTLSFHPQKLVSLIKLKNIPISTTYGCYKLLQKICKKHHFLPQINFISGIGNSAVYFAENGNCVAVTSGDCCKNLPDNMQRVPIKDKEFCFEQTLFWSNFQQQNPVIKLFLKFIQK